MEKEFTIDSLPKYEFRVGKISPVEMLAISTQINFDSYNQSLTFINFALEHLEVKMGNIYNPVKIKNKDVYMPIELSTNFQAMNDLVEYFLTNVVYEAFMKSSASQTTTE